MGGDTAGKQPGTDTDYAVIPLPPAKPGTTLEQWHTGDGESAPLPRAWYKFRVYLNGIPQPDAIAANVQQGVVTLIDREGIVIRDGKKLRELRPHYDVAKGLTRLVHGKVEIRLKPEFQ